MEESTEPETIIEKIKLKITSTIGYLLPLIVSIPAMGAWGIGMTVPFAVYLLLMMSNLNESPPLSYIMKPMTIDQVAAILFLIWSVVYLRKEKTEGLVTSGPYRYVRHPQYLSLIILTAIMTYKSVWILQHTDGTGWLSVDETKILWLLMLTAYAVIALIEEMHLQKRFGSQWREYRKRVGFLMPFAKYKSYSVEMLSGILIPYAVLEIILYMNAGYYLYTVTIVQFVQLIVILFLICSVVYLLRISSFQGQTLEEKKTR